MPGQANPPAKDLERNEKVSPQTKFTAPFVIDRGLSYQVSKYESDVLSHNRRWFRLKTECLSVHRGTMPV
ncbi:hypothetical protein D3C80_1154720 [compost metagenome]